ncbi:hypothetical protein [Kocuria carniphila]|uniref:restriction system modified-DNA reader domain-containing protein n=1 Tax=Kocuria carniphila TaxID=262208 RepID=UPI0034DB5F9C
MTSVSDLIEGGFLKPGDELKSTSPSRPASAALNADGSINFEGTSYKTPSGAGKVARGGLATNGWDFWAVVRDGRITPLTDIRAQYLDASPRPARRVSTVHEHQPDRPASSSQPIASALVTHEVTTERALAEPEETDEVTESAGLISAFGMFWNRNQVDWKKGRNVKILGHQAGEESSVNVASQIGVYLLHDGARTIYVGRVSAPRLGVRLWEHTKDRLSGRWDRFSWFGLRPVLSDGKLGDPAENFGTDLVVATMEALLIEGLEPPQNRRQGDAMVGQEYQQSVDHELKEQAAMQTLLRKLMQ